MMSSSSTPSDYPRQQNRHHPMNQNHQQQQEQLNQQQQISSSVIPSKHVDYILAMTMNVYGRRVATAGNDRFVHIHELNNASNNNNWDLTASFQAHKSGVTSISFANPEFGTLLATGGMDHEVKLWEEDTNTTATISSSIGNNTDASTSTNRWTLTASLGDARRAVRCVEFGPKHLGLKLAVGAADGCGVRIYDCVDPMNLSQWIMSTATTTSKSSSSNAVTSATSTTSTPNPASDVSNNNNSATSSYPVTSISWCTGRFDPPTLVASIGPNLIVYRYDDSARCWKTLPPLPLPTSTSKKGNATGSSSSSSMIHDVSWAPSIGRRYHTIAAVTEHNTILILKLSKDLSVVEQSTCIVSTMFCACQFNVTGTVLTCAGDGGAIELYKQQQQQQVYNNTTSGSSSSSGNNNETTGSNANNEYVWIRVGTS